MLLVPIVPSAEPIPVLEGDRVIIKGENVILEFVGEDNQRKYTVAGDERLGIILLVKKSVVSKRNRSNNCLSGTEVASPVSDFTIEDAAKIECLLDEILRKGDTAQNFARELQDLMVLLNADQQQLALLIGVTAPCVGYWVDKSWKPLRRPSKLLRIERVRHYVKQRTTVT